MKRRHLNSAGVCVLSMALLCACWGTASADLTDGLVAYYPFSGDATDATGNGHDGMVSGPTLTSDRYGSTDSAYSFDGDADYIDIPYDSEIEPPIFSISLWFKTDMAVDGCIINSDPDGASTHHGYHLWIEESPPHPYDLGTLTYYVDHSTGPEAPHSNLTYSDDALNDDVWHHIAALYDGIPRLYVDGDLHDTGEDRPYPQTGASIRIGMMRYDWSPPLYCYFDGAIDDIRIYNRVLTEDEIDQLSEPPTLIELLAFDANPHGPNVRITWETATEIDSEGFQLWRKADGEQEFIRITESLIPAEGGPLSGASYTYEDIGVEMGRTYWYKLEDIDIYGHSTFHGPVEITTDEPICFIEEAIGR